MKVFKFGGASVKDAEGVKNIVSVLQHTGFRETLIVVSAMGKTTNALEQVVHSFFENKEQFPHDLQMVRENHHHIIEHLFNAENTELISKVDAFFDGVLDFFCMAKFAAGACCCAVASLPGPPASARGCVPPAGEANKQSE